MNGTQGPGRTLGAFQVGPSLGNGPVGDVFRAKTAGDTRDLAIKILRSPAAQSPAVRQRFLAICATVAALDHPHILPIESFGEQGPQIYSVMPLVAQDPCWRGWRVARFRPKTSRRSSSKSATR